jgi:hypothetical protein
MGYFMADRMRVLAYCLCIYEQNLKLKPFDFLITALNQRDEANLESAGRRVNCPSLDLL